MVDRLGQSQPRGFPGAGLATAPRPFVAASASARSGRTPGDAGRTPRCRRTDNRGSRPNARTALHREVVGMLEDGQSDRQPCRQRRTARLVLVERAEPLRNDQSIVRESFTSALFMSMIASSREHNRSACPVFLWFHRRLQCHRKESRRAIRRKPRMKLQAFGPSSCKSLQSQTPVRPENRPPHSLG